MRKKKKRGKGEKKDKETDILSEKHGRICMGKSFTMERKTKKYQTVRKDKRIKKTEMKVKRGRKMNEKGMRKVDRIKIKIRNSG